MKPRLLLTEEQKKKARHLPIFSAVVLCIVILCALLYSSCNVTRTVTTKAEYYQKGDTTVQIVTRTTESYDGSVKPEMLLKK